jgi:ureidoacrylate peracid hydrolase
VSAISLPVRYRRETTGEPQAEVDESLEFSLGAAALLLVDVYPRDGEPAEVVRRSIVPARDAAQRARLPVVYVTNALQRAVHRRSRSREVWRRTLGEDVLETWREPSDVLEYLPEIAPAEADLVVRKTFYSGFHGTELDEVLGRLGARTLIVAGFDARICVAATATDALYRDFEVVVLRDAIGTSEAENVGAEGSALGQAIRYLETCVGYTALTADFIAALEG